MTILEKTLLVQSYATSYGVNILTSWLRTYTSLSYCERTTSLRHCMPDNNQAKLSPQNSQD